MTTSRRLFKHLFITSLWLVVVLVLIELLLQLGALAMKEQAWRAKSQWLSGNLRILALGDSNTYGLYLPAEDSYPAQLETLWNQRHPNAAIEVINLGYPGTNSFRLRANLPEILDTFHPDIVLLMIGFNDFWTPVEIPGTLAQLSWWEKLQYHSRLYQLFAMWSRQNQLEHNIDSGKRMLGGLSDVDFTDEELAYIQHTTQTDPKKNLETAVQDVLEKRKQQAGPRDILNTVKYGDKVFSLGIADGTSAGNSKQMPANIEAMLKYMDEKDISYFLLNYPTRFGYYAATNKKLAVFSGQENIPFIDLQNVFHPDCRVKPANCPELLFYDAHASAKGNQLIAEKVANELEHYLLTPSQLSR